MTRTARPGSPAEPETRKAGPRRRGLLCLLLLLPVLLLQSGCGYEPIDEAEVRRHAAWLQTALEQIHTANWLNQWQRFTARKIAPLPDIPGKNLPYYEIGNFWMWSGRVDDPQLGRTVELLYRQTIHAQFAYDPLIGQLVAELVERDRVGRRGPDGAPLSTAALSRVVRLDADREHRRAAWSALHDDPDGYSAERLVRLIHRRNAIAKTLGFDDYYDLSLEVEGLSSRGVDRLLKKLEGATRSAAQQAVAQLAESAPDRSARPWDVEHASEEVLHRLEPHLDAARLETRLRATMDGLGLPIESPPITLLALPVDTGEQRFLTFPVHIPDDIRVLITPGAGFYAYRAAFHECGHATYYAGAAQPDFVHRLPPNGAISEGFAKIFERLPYQPAWLESQAGVAPELAAEVGAFAAADELMRLRSFLGRHAFEKAAYKDPDQDLPALYQAIMSEHTFVSWQDAGSTWASDLHLATQPFSSLEYLHARLIQAQVERTLQQRFGGIVGSPEAGRFLLETLVRPGSTMSWQELIQEATGSSLSVQSYVEDELGL